MRCPNCGTENPEGASFCQKCSTPLVPGAMAPGAPMMGAPPAPKKSNALLIAIIAIVVVIVVVVAGTILALNAFRHAAQNEELTMTFVSQATVPAGDYSIAPPSGSHYVQITVRMHNTGSTTTVVSSVLFKLKASGTDYGITLFVNGDTSTATLSPGAQTNFKVSFQIPDTATPETIFYEPILGNQISAPI